MPPAALHQEGGSPGSQYPPGGLFVPQDGGGIAPGSGYTTVQSLNGTETDDRLGTEIGDRPGTETVDQKHGTETVDQHGTETMSDEVNFTASQTAVSSETESTPPSTDIQYNTIETTPTTPTPISTPDTPEDVNHTHLPPSTDVINDHCDSEEPVSLEHEVHSPLPEDSSDSVDSGTGGDGGAMEDGSTVVDSGSPVVHSGSPIVESGSPMVDSGSPMVDSGSPMVDSGSPMVDSGSPMVDSGSPVIDSGGPVVDSGGPVVDSGTPMVDSGGPVVDSGTPMVDSGTPMVDSGGPVVDSGGPVVDYSGTVVDDPELEEEMERSVPNGSHYNTEYHLHSGVEGEQLGGHQDGAADEEDKEPSLAPAPTADDDQSDLREQIESELVGTAGSEEVDVEGRGADQEGSHDDQHSPEDTNHVLKTHQDRIVEDDVTELLPTADSGGDIGENGDIGDDKMVESERTLEVEKTGREVEEDDRVPADVVNDRGYPTNENTDLVMEGNSPDCEQQALENGRSHDVHNIDNEGSHDSDGGSHDPHSEGSDKDSENMTSFSSDGMTNGSGAGMLTGQQKEKSVFLRLSNRIRDLEENMSLFSSYLDQISTGMKRNKNRTEDSQRSLERRLNSLNDSIQLLTNQTDLTLVALTELYHEVQDVSDTVHNMSDQLLHIRREVWQHCLLVIALLSVLEVSVFLTLWWLCSRTNNRSYDSHVISSRSHVTDYNYSYDHEPLPLNGITKSSHIVSDGRLLGATSQQNLDSHSEASSLQAWNKVERKRKRKTKTL